MYFTIYKRKDFLSLVNFLALNTFIIRTKSASVQFLIVPVYFHFGSKSLPALLNFTHEWMSLPERLLLLLPLHWMTLGLVLVHLPWLDASPPDTLLVLAQLALPAPLLGVDLTDMVWQTILPACSEPTPTTPGTGITEAKVESIGVFLPITCRTKRLPAMITLERFNLFVNCLDVPGKI